MERSEAIKMATGLAIDHGLSAYVHTDPTIGYNFRFMQPIESVLPNDTRSRTVCICRPDGTTENVADYERRRRE
jgi:hypothetical protein